MQVAPDGSLRCGCVACGRWKVFVRGELQGASPLRQYEVFTAELIRHLARYIRQRAAALSPQGGAVRVLEVGAGDGRLAHFVGEALRGPVAEGDGSAQAVGSTSGAAFGGCPGSVEGRSAGLAGTALAAAAPQILVSASDDGSLGLHTSSPYRHLVALEGAAAAVARVQPHIVLASWMPLGVDWTAAFRACPAVMEYILIGEADDGICGHPWLTWGLAAAADDASNDSDGGCNSDNGSGGDSRCADDAVGLGASALAPHQRDGFQRLEVSAGWGGPVQVCRTDERWSTRHHSSVVAFRRVS